MDRYGLDIFADSLPEGEPRTTALSFVRFARRVQEMSPDQVFFEFRELDDCLLPDDPQPHDTAERLAALVQRHADDTIAALELMYVRLSSRLARGEILPDSLLGLSFGEVEAVASPVGAVSAVNVFHKDAGMWTLTYQDRTVHIDESLTGLAYIARLLSAPHCEIHVLRLVGAIGEDREKLPGPPDELRVARDGDPGDLADPKALAEYLSQYETLEAQLQAAQARGDLRAIAEGEERLAAFAPFVRSIRGLGGRSRKFTDEEEKARKSVWAVTDRAMNRIERSHPDLGAHLRTAIKISRSCCYRPDPPTSWRT